MNLGLKGKRALITGGATGIGKSIAIDLAKEGVKLVITSRDPKELKKTLKEIGGEKPGHFGISCHLTNSGAPQKLAKRIFKEIGGLDIVVNNIGSSLGISDPFCPISDWRKLFRINLEVIIEINNQFIPYMMKRKWGRIVNISSAASMENNGPVPYCASKAALTAYSRSMARVLAPQNIVMSAILPGVVLTERGHWAQVLKERPEHAERYLRERCPLGRFGRPQEISPMVVMLCSELASFAQGAIVPIDGAQGRHFYQVDGI